MWSGTGSPVTRRRAVLTQTARALVRWAVCAPVGGAWARRGLAPSGREGEAGSATPSRRHEPLWPLLGGAAARSGVRSPGHR
jgi:hypothetical protein